MNLAAIEEECRRLLLSGESRENIIALLRKKGCSKVRSIQILHHANGMTIQEAKTAVDGSPTWADVRQRDSELHDNLDEISG